MKALVYTGVKEMEFRDEPDPTLGVGENLISVKSVGICGSDMHAYVGHDDRRPAPLILGHEGAGDVIDGPMKGQRVTINPLATCGTCRDCTTGQEHLCQSRQILSMPPRQGAFAELVKSPSANLVVVPDDVSFDKAALAEPLAVCWHAVRKGSETLSMDIKQAKCLVLGGGAIGVGCALSLIAWGVTDILVVEPNSARAKNIEKIGAYKTTQNVDDEEAEFDLIIDAVGYRATRETASRLVRQGGCVVHVGLGDSNDGLDIRRFTLQEIAFVGTYCYTPQDFKDTCAAIFDGRFGSLDWIETRSLADGIDAFQQLLNGQVASPKIVLNP